MPCSAREEADNGGMRVSRADVRILGIARYTCYARRSPSHSRSSKLAALAAKATSRMRRHTQNCS
eukprot:147034-Prorocentrum_minimum.AAC.4